MKKIFIGLLFVYLSISITLNGGRVDLMPSFIGFYFLWQGLKEMSLRSKYFASAVNIAMILIPVTAVTWITGLFVHGLIGTLISIGVLAAKMYILYQIVSGVDDMQARFGIDMNAKNLKLAWMGLVIGYIAEFLPFFSLVGMVIYFAALIFFLVSFYKSWKKYEKYFG